MRTRNATIVLALFGFTLLLAGCGGGGGGGGGVNLPVNPPTDPPSTLPTLTITATDSLAVESGAVVEGGMIRITRTGDTDAALTVSLAVSGTVSNLVGEDFDQAPLGATIDIPAGSDRFEIAVDPIDDAEVEGRESLVVTLKANSADYDLGSSTEATVDFFDNDTVVENIDATVASNRIIGEQGNPLFAIIDVRTPAEYAGGHLKGSININYFDADFNDRIAALDPAGTYLVHCKSGARSAPARDLMEQDNIRMIWNMLGGINAWVAAGYPVDTD